ncbi:zinc finger protein 234-like [Diaphorina citri]|jgi:Zinc finger, C2H2 type.|uniref:Zinc finger protein 234-like n=1 Tax=Diaphorina citri TaxID=121845 RepID=A0A1S3DU61_DIACI|nr:zinc finger protein 234-like [Diaphorina citri]
MESSSSDINKQTFPKTSKTSTSENENHKPSCGNSFMVHKNQPIDTGDFSLEQWRQLVAEKTKLCPVCNKEYATPVTMRKHLREVHVSKKKFKCDLCQKQFKASRSLQCHKQFVHLGVHKPKFLNMECDYCSRKFPSKNEVTNHIKSHMGVRDILCPICKKGFIALKHMKTHLKKHMWKAGEIPLEDTYLCDLCSKVFLEHKDMIRHREWVHGDKCHVCKVCGAKIKGNMKRHMLSHTGEKPFCCDICGKSLKGNLKAHILRCQGERPYKCDVCGSSFKDKKHFSVHIRNHGEDK